MTRPLRPYDVQVGDIIGFCGNSWQSSAINLVTYGWPFWPVYSLSHVGIIGEFKGEKVLYESTTFDDKKCLIQKKLFHGSQCHRLQDRLEGYPGVIWHYPL